MVRVAHALAVRVAVLHSVLIPLSARIRGIGRFGGVGKELLIVEIIALVRELARICAVSLLVRV